MVQMAINLRNVRKQRRSKMIGPINLNLPEGHIIALVGQNGSGKSTLMQMLLQQTHPDQGEICWYERKHGTALPLELRQSMAYVPEISLTEENFWNVEEAAAFRSHWYPEWDHSYYQDLLDKFEVPRNIPLGKMSKGERRKFEIAAALAARPRLLLLDEPSSGLDPFAWKVMIEVLRRYMDDVNATIILSTHIVDEVKRLADYIVLMHRGELLGMAEKDSLFGKWSEVWVNAANEEELSELSAAIPGVSRSAMETPGVASLIIEHYQLNEKRIHDLGVKVIKVRSLELDEILSLWTQGHCPNLVNYERGD